MKKTSLHSSTFWTISFWGWATLIVFLTALPGKLDIIPEKEHFRVRIDYLEHIFVFIILSMLFFPYFHFRKVNSIVNKPLIFWLIAGLLFAAITEIYQIFIPLRAFNPWDLILNISGIFLGILPGRWFYRYLIKISSKKR